MIEGIEEPIRHINKVNQILDCVGLKNLCTIEVSLKIYYTC